MTELDALTACLKGEDFTFDVSALACAVSTLQYLAADLPALGREDDAEDIETAIAACEALYRHLGRFV